MPDYVNQDHPALSWDLAAWLVVDGDAAMTVLGDFASNQITQPGARRSGFHQSGPFSSRELF